MISAMGRPSSEHQHRRQLSLAVVARGQRDLVEHIDRTGPIAAGGELASQAERRTHHGMVGAPQRPVVPLGTTAAIVRHSLRLSFSSISSAVAADATFGAASPGSAATTRSKHFSAALQVCRHPAR